MIHFTLWLHQETSVFGMNKDGYIISFNSIIYIILYSQTSTLFRNRIFITKTKFSSPLSNSSSYSSLPERSIFRPVISHAKFSTWHFGHAAVVVKNRLELCARYIYGAADADEILLSVQFLIGAGWLYRPVSTVKCISGEVGNWGGWEIDGCLFIFWSKGGWWVCRIRYQIHHLYDRSFDFRRVVIIIEDLQ